MLSGHKHTPNTSSHSYLSSVVLAVEQELHCPNHSHWLAIVVSVSVNVISSFRGCSLR